MRKRLNYVRENFKRKISFQDSPFIDFPDNLTEMMTTSRAYPQPNEFLFDLQE